MYRILSKKVLFVALAWLVLGVALIVGALEELLDQDLRLSVAPASAWLILNIALWNPIWRFLWKTVPKLNEWVFPDLNGEWEVEIFSNWDRQQQLLDAAASTDLKIDMRLCPDSNLAPLKPVRLRAEIVQTWWSFEMRMDNPLGTTPIDHSETISVDPIRKKGLSPAGICYFYKQTNRTDSVSDDIEFYGAARLTYDYKSGSLTGLTWTARKWRRAMNTAGMITFTRRTT